MVFLRSEEHEARWLEAQERPPGATLPAATLNDLAQRWWSNRLDEDWRPRPLPESQAILDGLGLTGPFWQLA